ncbi:MAG: hypothetical protein LBL13_11215 [Bacteroidales bacterium]|jgi:hypothetical protein|nr:hypothetical protein [Bacteroidales bacterium]
MGTLAGKDFYKTMGYGTRLLRTNQDGNQRFRRLPDVYYWDKLRVIPTYFIKITELLIPERTTKNIMDYGYDNEY